MKLHKIIGLFISLSMLTVPVYGNTCPFKDHFNDPDEFVQRFYGWVFSKDLIDTEDMKLLSNCFEKTFYKNLLLKMSIHGEGEIADYEFDYSPFLQAQDIPDGFKILKDKTSKTLTTAHVFVQFDFDNKPYILNVSLIKQGNNWKISNIIGEHIDLKKEVDEAAQYLKEKN